MQMLHITLRKEMMQKERVIPETTHQIDLRSSSIDVKGFDVSVWFHYLKQFLYEETAMMSYGDPQGEYVLRRALQMAMRCAAYFVGKNKSLLAQIFNRCCI